METKMGLPAENRVDVAAALRHAQADGPIWSLNAEQLNMSLIRLTAGATIPQHVNDALDVLIIVLEGSGELTVDGELSALAPGIALLIPRGVERGIRCTSGPLVYVSAHRQRGGLLPTTVGSSRS
jgi:quercetin dioxygenase-like cupin family protein